MRKTQIKPGQILAWKPKYRDQMKVRVVGWGKTEGYAFYYQGNYSRPGIQVEILEGGEDLRASDKDYHDRDGNPIAQTKELLGEWDAVIAQQKAEREEQTAKYVAANAEYERRQLLKQELADLVADLGLTTVKVAGEMTFGPEGMLALIREVQSAQDRQARYDVEFGQG